jgi:hypothetical protein
MTIKNDEKECHTANIGLPQWGLTCLNDSIVLNQSAVLRLNFCTKNPPLRQAENRYRSCYYNSATNYRQCLNQEKTWT